MHEKKKKEQKARAVLNKTGEANLGYQNVVSLRSRIHSTFEICNIRTYQMKFYILMECFKI